MTAKMLFDPFGLVLEVFNDLYPDKSAEIYWRQGMKDSGDCYGATDFEHDPPIIEVDVGLPVTGAIDVLAHELAHVAAGFVKPAHGKAWKAAFSAIHSEYMERVEKLEAAKSSDEPKVTTSLSGTMTIYQTTEVVT